MLYRKPDPAIRAICTLLNLCQLMQILDLGSIMAFEHLLQEVWANTPRIRTRP